MKYCESHPTGQRQEASTRCWRDVPPDLLDEGCCRLLICVCVWWGRGGGQQTCSVCEAWENEVCCGNLPSQGERWPLGSGDEEEGWAAMCGQQRAGLSAAWPLDCEQHTHGTAGPARVSGHRQLALLRPLQTGPPQPSQHLCPGSRMKIWVPAPLPGSMQVI